MGWRRAYKSVELEVKSTRERYIRVPAMAIMIQDVCWNICIEQSN